MSSTSEDMAKFMIAHLQDVRYGNASILDEATAKQMHSQLFTNDPKVNGMAYGFWDMNQHNQSYPKTNLTFLRLVLNLVFFADHCQRLDP